MVCSNTASCLFQRQRSKTGKQCILNSSTGLRPFWGKLNRNTQGIKSHRSFAFVFLFRCSQWERWFLVTATMKSLLYYSITTTVSNMPYKPISRVRNKVFCGFLLGVDTVTSNGQMQPEIYKSVAFCELRRWWGEKSFSVSCNVQNFTWKLLCTDLGTSEISLTYNFFSWQLMAVSLQMVPKKLWRNGIFPATRWVLFSCSCLSPGTVCPLHEDTECWQTTLGPLDILWSTRRNLRVRVTLFHRRGFLGPLSSSLSFSYDPVLPPCQLGFVAEAEWSKLDKMTGLLSLFLSR